MNENCHKTYLRYFYDKQSQSIAKQTEWASFELRGGIISIYLCFIPVGLVSALLFRSSRAIRN